MEEDRLKWTNLAKEHAVLFAKVKKVSGLESDVTELHKTIFELCNTHQNKIERLRGIHFAEIEHKDAFFESEKL